MFKKSILEKIKKIKDIFLIKLINPALILIPDKKDWVVMNIVKNLSKELKNQRLISTYITKSTSKLKNKIIHLSPIFTAIKQIPNADKSNKIIVSWFHVNNLPIEKEYADIIIKNNILVHTTCTNTKKDLLKLKILEEKIKVIPLGINSKIFKPTNNKAKAKSRLNLPQNKIIIGSFQKDGEGWQEGNEPKLIKGPDIFCDVVEKLSKKYPIHILLTGPARGYVKNRLTKANISFTHKYLKNYNDIVKYYHALDLYLITSRLEGGPMAILESWATGTPLVSTKVGMIPDIASDTIDTLLADIENIDQITTQAEKIIENKDTARKLSSNAIKKAQKYSWQNISNIYYQELYKKTIYE